MIFGQIYFYNHQASFFNPETDTMICEDIPAGTIVIDPGSFSPGCIGAINNTIAHECVHFELHRKCFEFERLLQQDLSLVSCRMAGGIKEDSNHSLDMMEWQANAIASRILMPRESFKARADELIYNLKKETGYSQTIDVMEDVIETLAAEFRVSRTAAKIRCIDLGFTEAIGCFNYIDGRYLKPYNQKNDEGQVRSVILSVSLMLQFLQLRIRLLQMKYIRTIIYMSMAIISRTTRNM